MVSVINATRTCTRRCSGGGTCFKKSVLHEIHRLECKQVNDETHGHGIKKIDLASIVCEKKKEPNSLQHRKQLIPDLFFRSLLSSLGGDH